MNSTSTHFVPSRRMGIYETVSMWGDFKENDCLDTSPSMILEVEGNLDPQMQFISQDTSHGTVGPSNKYDHVTSKPVDKVLRRLAQNREAARKCRLRKKAYVQKLESSKLRLIELTRELQRARQQGLYMSGVQDLSHSGTMNPGIATFEMEYGHWVEEQDRQVLELRKALHSSNGDMDLQFFVNNGMRHYLDLFTMKAAAAKADVFYLMSGSWKTSAERYFSWIGGFRPSELLKILLPHLQPLSEQQELEIYNLRQSCLQAEDALSQGMDKLRQNIAETVSGGGQLGEGYYPQIVAAREKLEALVRFVNQADHLRRETLQQIARILNIHQAARGLLALGEYFQCLRALSSLWGSRPREGTSFMTQNLDAPRVISNED